MDAESSTQSFPLPLTGSNQPGQSQSNVRWVGGLPVNFDF